MERRKRVRLGVEAWRGLFVRYAGSELSVETFCRREAVSTSSFYRWRGLLVSEPTPSRGLTCVSAAVIAKPPSRGARHATPVGTSFVDLGPLRAPTVAPRPAFELRLDLGDGLLLSLVRG
jgi:hypothetical protein